MRCSWQRSASDSKAVSDCTEFDDSRKMMPTELVAVLEPGPAEPPTDVSDAWTQLRAENDKLRRAVNKLGQETSSLSTQFERDMLGARSEIEM